MLVVVTFVCLYFGLWEVTKRWGVVNRPEGKYPNDIFYVDSSQAVGSLIVKTNLSILPTLKREGVVKTTYELRLFGPRFTIWESNCQINPSDRTTVRQLP